MYIITPKKTQNVILKYTSGCFYDVLGTPIVVWGTIWHGISFAVLKQCTSILLGTNKTLSSILENRFLCLVKRLTVWASITRRTFLLFAVGFEHMSH